MNGAEGIRAGKNERFASCARVESTVRPDNHVAVSTGVKNSGVLRFHSLVVIKYASRSL